MLGCGYKNTIGHASLFFFEWTWVYGRNGLIRVPCDSEDDGQSSESLSLKSHCGFRFLFGKAANSSSAKAGFSVFVKCRFLISQLCTTDAPPTIDVECLRNRHYQKDAVPVFMGLSCCGVDPKRQDRIFFVIIACSKNLFSRFFKISLLQKRFFLARYATFFYAELPRFLTA